jgi:hypothetical protein
MCNLRSILIHKIPTMGDDIKVVHFQRGLLLCYLLQTFCINDLASYASYRKWLSLTSSDSRLALVRGLRMPSLAHTSSWRDAQWSTGLLTWYWQNFVLRAMTRGWCIVTETSDVIVSFIFTIEPCLDDPEGGTASYVLHGVMYQNDCLCYHSRVKNLSSLQRILTFRRYGNTPHSVSWLYFN